MDTQTAAMREPTNPILIQSLGYACQQGGDKGDLRGFIFMEHNVKR